MPIYFVGGTVWFWCALLPPNDLALCRPRILKLGASILGITKVWWSTSMEKIGEVALLQELSMDLLRELSTWRNSGTNKLWHSFAIEYWHKNATTCLLPKFSSNPDRAPMLAGWIVANFSRGRKPTKQQGGQHNWRKSCPNSLSSCWRVASRMKGPWYPMAALNPWHCDVTLSVSPHAKGQHCFAGKTLKCTEQWKNRVATISQCWSRMV